MVLQNIVIFVTDSMANVKSGQTVHEARMVHNDGITVVGIGINIVEKDELREIASQPSSKYVFETHDYYNLYQLVPVVSAYICAGKLLRLF